MISVSQQFLSAMENRTDFIQRATITLRNGTELKIGVEETDTSDFALKGGSFVDAADSSFFPLGQAICRQIEIEILNEEGQLEPNGTPFDFTGASIVLFLDFTLDDGSVEEILVGTFTVLTPVSWGDTVVIDAVDDMYKADQPYVTALTFPATAESVLSDACDSIGLTCDANFKNKSMNILSPPSSDYTVRQVIGFLALLAGGNARVDRDGTLKILSYDFDASGHSITDWMNEFTSDFTDTEISGLRCGGVLSGSDGYVLDLTNPLLAGYTDAEISTFLGTFSLVGKSFRTFEGSTFSYPLAEFMDSIRVRNKYDGESYGLDFTTILTDVRFQLAGQTVLKTAGESPVTNGAEYGSEAQTAIIEAKKIAEDQRVILVGMVDDVNSDLQNTNANVSQIAEELAEVQETADEIARYIDINPNVPNIIVGSNMGSSESYVEINGTLNTPYVEINGGNGASARFEDSRMDINEIKVNNTAQFGNFAWITLEENSNLALRYIGG